MGQSISRRAVPRLTKAFQQYESAAAKDALDDMAQRQALARSGKTGGYSDPNAVHGGFRRENAPTFLPQETAQEEFLRQKAAATGGQAAQSSQQEMPDDLLQFLNDNPLEKTVDRNLTSPKVLDSLLAAENDTTTAAAAAQTNAKRAPRTRTRRTMPLAESMVEDLPDDVSADIAGATGVERTTNFSTDGEGGSDADAEEARLDRLLRLADRELAALLREHGATLASSDASDAAIGNDAGKDAAKQKQQAASEAYLADRLAASDFASAEKLLGDEKLSAYTSLLSKALRYSGMPVLLKDQVDADYVGVWADRVKELEKMKLRVVKEEETTLLFEGRAGKIADEANAKGPTDASSNVQAPEIKAQGPQQDLAVPGSKPSIEQKEDDWKKQYMEEMKKIKGKVGSTGPATRKFLEEEAARAAVGAAELETDKESSLRNQRGKSNK